MQQNLYFVILLSHQAVFVLVVSLLLVRVSSSPRSNRWNQRHGQQILLLFLPCALPERLPRVLPALVRRVDAHDDDKDHGRVGQGEQGNRHNLLTVAGMGSVFFPRSVCFCFDFFLVLLPSGKLVFL